MSAISLVTTETRHTDSDAIQMHATESSIELRVAQEDEAPAHAIEAIPDGGYGWMIIFDCSLILFWLNGYNTTWGVLQTALLKRSKLNVDIQTITFAGTLSLGLLCAFGMASVRIMRAIGARNSFVVGMFFFGMAPILASFTLDNIGGLFVTVGALMGISSALVYAATNSLPILWFNKRLGIANGLVKAGGGVGATVLPLATQALIDRVGLAWTFRLLGIMMLATSIPAALSVRERGSSGQASRFEWSLLKNVNFMSLCIAGAVGVFALFVPPFFLPLFAESIGLSASTGAGLVAGFGASTAVGRLACGWACDRIGAFNTLALAAFMNSVSMLAIWPVSSSLPPLMIFALVNGCANGGFFVALPTAIATLAPGTAGAAISLMVSFWTPGYLLGPPIAGMLIQATGAAESSSIGPYRGAIFYSAGVGLLSTVLIIFSRMKLDAKVLKKL